MRVLRAYHAGRDGVHRERDRALTRAGVEVTLLVPDRWPGPDDVGGGEPFEIVSLPVRRPGDVNRHSYADRVALRRLLHHARPDVLDLHEEPFSRVARQLLGVAPRNLPVVAYSAQNIDKRWPPPFHQWEQAALTRLSGAYPCSRQAASVLRGRGFAGPISVVALGVDRSVFGPGKQLPDGEITLGFVGRLVPEKGVLDALEVLARVRARRAARLVIVGEGSGEPDVHRRARELGVDADVRMHPWCDPAELAAHYRRMHVLLAPSRTTATWAEQFGRVVTEARACGAAVVAYASGALPEVVADPGALVAEGDVEGMADAVLRLLDGSWPLVRARGLAGVVDWDEIARAQLLLYRRALDPPGPAVVGRAAAVAEFGPTAPVFGVTRPFALPVLRRHGATGRALARVLDRSGRG